MLVNLYVRLMNNEHISHIYTTTESTEHSSGRNRLNRGTFEQEVGGEFPHSAVRQGQLRRGRRLGRRGQGRREEAGHDGRGQLLLLRGARRGALPAELDDVAAPRDAPEPRADDAGGRPGRRCRISA